MKKLVKIIGGLFCALMMFGCSDLAELNSDSGDESLGTLYFDSKSRFVDVSKISNATVKVYSYGKKTVQKDGVSVNGGKGTLSVENIPVGKNRVIEISGYKTAGVPVKILYAVTDINPGANSIGTIKDGVDSAKGKAYLALLNAGVDISSVALSGFDGVSSAYLFDADGFAASYKTNSSVSAATYAQTTGTVKFTNIKSASGYSVWIDDPLSGKLSIDSDSTTSSSLSGVAPGSWKVYVNDGSATKVVGTVTVPSGDSADFDTLIGNALAGKTVIFVKCAANTNLYAWTETSKTELCGAWSGTTLTTKATSDYMNDPSGWYMVDVTEKYGSSTEKIKIILIPQGGSQSGDLESNIAGTFWYDGSKFYDSDPTTVPTLDSNATLKEIKVNGTSIGLKTEYEVPFGTKEVTVTAVANSAKATVSVSPSADDLVVGEPKSFLITVTAQDGTVKTYSLFVIRKAEDPNDVTLSSINVNGSSIGALSSSGTSFKKSLSGSDDSCSVSVTAEASSSSAEITITPKTATITDGKSQVFTITVKNGSASATYTLTVDYTKVEASQYYWTNKNGAVGVNKTIKALADWDESMKVAQAAACDTPRAWLGGHEYPDPDLYAIFAAWDDTNLYLMVEIPNVDGADTVDNDQSYAGSQFLPMGWVLNTGKGVAGDGALVDGNSVWQKALLYSWSTGIDTMIMYHPRLGIGEPSVFQTNSDGKFSYDDEYCVGFEKAGITRDVYFNECVSKNMWAAVVDEEGNWGGKKSKDMSSYNYIDYLAAGKKMSAYQVTVPLESLGVTKSYIEETGISVGVFSTYGASTMDCIPWDSCMIDVADEAYSSDPSSSKEKEDVDVISASLARIGHM
ncbi:MAG: cadherin-like beta sandwich domain-containing protein [Treponema sp.]|nr:cadherin-like beta sandwich domain-containing protein [Treponema sp.]